MRWYYLPTTWIAVAGGLALLAAIVASTTRGRWWIAPAVGAAGAIGVSAYLGYRVAEEQEKMVAKAAGSLAVVDTVKSVIDGF